MQQGSDMSRYWANGLCADYSEDPYIVDSHLRCSSLSPENVQIQQNMLYIETAYITKYIYIEQYTATSHRLLSQKLVWLYRNIAYIEVLVVSDKFCNTHTVLFCITSCMESY